MSENYPSDVKLNENPDGTVSFATEVVATIAGLAATEVDGVASMSSPSSGFADMFSRKNTRNFTKGVRIDLDGSKVTVDVNMVVEYGSPVPEVARNIQENVKKAVETMTGLEVKAVDIHVAGISFEREQKANAELDEQHRKMLEKTAETASAPEAEAVKAPAEEEEESAGEAALDDEYAEEDDDIEEEEDDEEEDDDAPEVIDDEPEPKPAPAPAPQPEPAPAPARPAEVQEVPAPVEEAPAPIEEQDYEDIEQVLSGDEDDKAE